jgi:hypothetical protein
MGSGEPDVGDPWGTWGGYYSWDTGTITDSANVWKATVYLSSTGDYPVDIPGFDSSRANISIRRPQQFSPTPSGSISWELQRLSDSRTLHSGWELVENNGVVTIPDVTIYKEKCELIVRAVPTSISAAESGIIQVYPNPVSSTATIEFQISHPGNVRVEIHNLAGQLNDMILDEFRPAGANSAIWDSGSLPSGIYICRLKAGPEVIRRKIILSR